MVLNATGYAAAAQESPSDLLTNLEGLESAHARGYRAVSEIARGSSSTPASVANPSSATAVKATVLGFGFASDVAVAFDQLLDEDLARFILDTPGMEFSIAEPAALGDQARIFVGPASDGEETIGLHAVQDCNHGFIVTAKRPGVSFRDTLLDFGSFMVDAESATGDVVISSEGVASGGTFDVLTAAGNLEVLNDMIPMHDYDLLESNSPIEGPPATPAT